MTFEIAYLSYNDNDQELKQRSLEILNGFFKSDRYVIQETISHILNYNFCTNTLIAADDGAVAKLTVI